MTAKGMCYNICVVRKSLLSCLKKSKLRQLNDKMLSPKMNRYLFRFAAKMDKEDH